MKTLERFLLCKTILFLHIRSSKQAGCAPVFITYSNQPEENMETLYSAVCSVVNINQLWSEARIFTIFSYENIKVY